VKTRRPPNPICRNSRVTTAGATRFFISAKILRAWVSYWVFTPLGVSRKRSSVEGRSRQFRNKSRRQPLAQMRSRMHECTVARTDPACAACGGEAACRNDHVRATWVGRGVWSLNDAISAEIDIRIDCSLTRDIFTRGLVTDNI
jgi:hypothetical protein